LLSATPRFIIVFKRAHHLPVSSTISIQSTAQSSLIKVKLKQSSYRPGGGPEGSRKLRFPNFVTTAQDGGRLSALSIGLVFISVGG